MCEQTPVEYKNGDIVWVKLGSCWWPGEVQDLNSLSEETIAGFKKPIIAAVKFFDEDYFEYVKSLDRIYYYNCSKKNEFIKKGLDLHRAKHDYMKKFPGDVSKAEEKTNGNPNIIDDPMFAPEKKTNIAALIFGSPKPKKSPKKSMGSHKKSLGSKSPGSTKKTPNRVITHPRFLGQDDHEVRILLQTPEHQEPPEEEPIIYKCMCGFSTVRVDVSIMHHKSHIQGYLTPKSLPNMKKRSAFKKNKKPSKMVKSKTSTIIEDLDLIDKGLFFESESSDTDSLVHNSDRGPKRKKKPNKRKPRKKEEPKPIKPNTVVDIRGDLLAEWDEDDSDAEKNDTLNTLVDSASPPTNKTIELNHQVDKEGGDCTKGDKSCFDFEEDEVDEIVGTSVGRKIPRVIPPPDRPKSTDSLDIPISENENNADSLQTTINPSQSSLCSTDEARYDSGNSSQDTSSNENSIHLLAKDLPDCTLNKNDIMKIIHQVEDAKEDDAKRLGKSDSLDDDAFKDILEATTVPALPEIPHSLKLEPALDSSETKSPLPDVTSKPEVVKESTESTSKLINPKKRFVKSFEDFEQQIHNEQKKLLELEQAEKQIAAAAAAAAIQDLTEKQLPPKEEISSPATESKEDEAESIKKITSGTVEVSKLKTQIKNKLESAEVPDEYTAKPPKRPRLLRDRILSNLKDECEQLHKQSANLLINQPEAIEPDRMVEPTQSILSCSNTRSSMEMHDVPEELLEPSVGNDHTELLPVLEIAEVTEPEEPSSAAEESAQTAHTDEPAASVSEERRLSIKMCEISEFAEIKETTELLELEEKVQLEPSPVVEEDKDTLDAINVEPLMETQTETSIDSAASAAAAATGDGADHKPADEEKEQVQVVPGGEEPVLSTGDESSSASSIIQEESATSEESLQTEEEVVPSNALSEPCISFTHTNLETRSPEDLSALTTLATISELTTSFDMHYSALPSEKSKVIEENLTFVDKPINFVTMNDLADGQVEISDVSVSKVKSTKPLSLANFSVDFGDSTETTAHSSSPALRGDDAFDQDDMNQPDSIEMSLGKVFEGENDAEEATPFNLGKRNSHMLDSSGGDLDDEIPSLLICNSKQPFKKLKTKAIYEKIKPPEYSSSSKLLEILTDGKPKPATADDGVESPVFGKASMKAAPVSKEGSTKTVSKAKEEKSAIMLPTSISKVVAKVKEEKAYSLGKEPITTRTLSKFDVKNTKFILRSSLKSFTPPPPPPPPSFDKPHKPIILSEKIIKTLSEPSESVSVQKVTSKHTMQDFEDIDAYIIQRPSKKFIRHKESPEAVVEPAPARKTNPPRGKAKILQQTIIKPAAELTPPTTTTATLDDSMFDINSMPIVLGDQILTTEGMEGIPVVLSDAPAPPPPTTTSATKVQVEQQKVLLSTKPPATTATTQPLILKTYAPQKLGKPRIYQTTPTSTSKILKSNPAVISRQGKHDKYIILPSSSASGTTSKYTVGKRHSIGTKRMTPVILPTPAVTQKLQGAEPSGNKIMIVTNQQGQQSRVLLTPAQQKMFGYQTPGSKLVKSTLKGNILQKTSAAKSSVISSVVGGTSSSNKVSNIVSRTLGEIVATTKQNVEPTLMTVKSTSSLRSIKTDHTTKPGRKFQMQRQKVPLHEGLTATFKASTATAGQQKTIVIKNQQGQIVKKIQGTDDAFLEQQVAEQVQAIKASTGSFSGSSSGTSSNLANKMKPPIKRSYPKKSDTAKNLKIVTNVPKKDSVPPLAPISPIRTESLLLSHTVVKSNENKADANSTAQKPLNQLIIQDALGNQTTIMEGQILALPSGDTVDGQPQSYMLVTLDESGNLAPLNNEALLSLDPNLSLGGDLSNMVLQVDDGGTLASKKSINSSKIIGSSSSTSSTAGSTSSATTAVASLLTSVEDAAQIKNIIQVSPQLQPPAPTPMPPPPPKPEATPKLDTEPTIVDSAQPTVQTVTCSIGNDPNQQLIITGDPISTQKFIESLTEGNPDLANLLASAEGNILIQTDEQQILINTDAENQVLLPLSSERLDGTESNSGNPIFATTQPVVVKNQDILAAALADTDVFQPEQIISPLHTKMGQAQLSPTGGLYQAGVSNVLETTLSLSSPIMTPLEIPSTNSKKIPDNEMDLLTTEVPKNVDLPITITDPNISTVAQQQAVTLIANELTTSLDLPISISEQVVVPLTVAEIHSPSYGFPLSSLDESVQKSFSGPISMPLLTEDPQESIVEEGEVTAEEIIDEMKVEEETIATAVASTDTVVAATDEQETIAINGDKLFETDDGGSSPKTFLRSTMESTMESEEGLCTLGGAMCSSLSEPPPDMFDLSLVGSHFVTESEIKISVSDDVGVGGCLHTEEEEDDDSPACGSTIEQVSELNRSGGDEEFNSFDLNNKMDNSILNVPPLNSVSSSPLVNVDEDSCEIPVQPQIVTDLSSSSFDSVDVSTNFESNKRVADDYSSENDSKKIKFD